MLDISSDHKREEQSEMEQVVDDANIQMDTVDSKNDQTTLQGEYENEQEETSSHLGQSDSEA